jgi:hypothetical protein
MKNEVRVDVKEVDLGFFEISYTLYHRNEKLQQGMNREY